VKLPDATPSSARLPGRLAARAELVRELARCVEVEERGLTEEGGRGQQQRQQQCGAETD
jgi:hypothetical protein